VQVGAWNRLGKRLATGKASAVGSGSCRTCSNPGVGECGLGAGDRMVVTGATTMGDGRGAAGMSSRVTCPPRSYPRCWWMKES